MRNLSSDERKKVTFLTSTNSSPSFASNTLLPPPPPPHSPPPLSNQSSPSPSSISSIFILPSPPKIKKITQPTPWKRINPGYDMRTLRKQIEEIRNEIIQRFELQGLLYNENEVLWNYLKELYQSFEKNSTILHSQIEKTNQTLQDLHYEKAEIADKLRDAQGSYREMEKIQLEQQKLKNEILEAERKKIEAQTILQRFNRVR